MSNLYPCTAVLLICVALASCSSGQLAPRTDQQRNIDGLPSWFVNQPTSGDHVDGVGSGESPDLQMAISIARSTARARMAEAISVQTGVINRNFGEQVATNSNGVQSTELTTFFESLNRDIASETINGAQQKDQVIQDNGRGGYRVYTWLQMPIGEVSRIYLEKIRRNQAVGARLRATSAFEDLEERVREYEAQRGSASDEQ